MNYVSGFIGLVRRTYEWVSAPRTAYPRMPKVVSSGDLLLDRRREWALASAQEGFHEAAAEIYEQILERAPWWAIAWFELGREREQLGDLAGAIAAFEAALARDSGGLLAADLKLAALGARPVPAAPPENYVAGLFDQYADKFDKHLVETLEYRGPALLHSAIERAASRLERPSGFRVAYDLGCGTGLMGVEMRGQCDAIDGVDLSQKMIDVAKSTGVYRNLDTGDVCRWLGTSAAGVASLVMAADVFVYIGDLGPVFAESARVLEPGGLFAFSVQKSEAEAYVVGGDMRFAHSTDYLRQLAADHGLETVSIEEASTRRDRGEPVPGVVAVMSKA
jgi:predicted TPR repeat methyltransferase